MVVRAAPPVELPPRVLDAKRDRCGARERCCAEKENESGRSRSAKRLLSRVELRNHLARRCLADGPLEGAHNARGQGANAYRRKASTARRKSVVPRARMEAFEHGREAGIQRQIFHTPHPVEENCSAERRGGQEENELQFHIGPKIGISHGVISGTAITRPARPRGRESPVFPWSSTA